MKRILKRVLRGGIGLSVDWASPNTVSVSWYDPVTVEQADGKKISGIAGYVGTVLLVGGLVLPFLLGAFWLLLLLLVAAIYGFVASTFQELNKKTVTFDQTSARFSDRQIGLNRVSRVAISAYEDWYDLTDDQRKNSNKIPFKRTVDLWIDDIERIEMSRNNFSKETNLYIKSAIEDALANIKKASVKKEQDKANGEASDFGMPDY